MMNRKRAPRQREQAIQPELNFEEVPQDRPENWTHYSHRDLLEYDEKRRSWLREWAQARNYALRWCTMWGKYSGYYQTSVPAGAESWEHFLENATYYDIYCFFVGVFTAGVPLSQYLEDAARRGEVKGLIVKG